MDSFWDTFHAYIRSYLPQWRYDPAGGEIESAVLLAAAELIAESGTQLAALPQKHELAFLQGWAAEPLDPDPMYVYAALTAPEGRAVCAGTEFYLSGDGERLWRTVEDARAEAIRLTDQFLTGGGKVMPLPLPDPEQPVRLFDFRGDGMPGPEIQFSHPDAFRSQSGCQVSLILPEASAQMLEFLGGEAVRWRLIGSCGAEFPLNAPVNEQRQLLFRLPAAPDGCALRCGLPAAGLPEESIGPAAVSARRTALPPALIWDGTAPCAGDCWLPFGDVPEVWRTCCLSCPDALALRGARLTVSFAFSLREREDLLPGMEREGAYRPVMRRLPAPPPPLWDVRADGVLWEYWNGRIWLPIPGTESCTGCFAAAEQGGGRMEFQFLWPADAVPCEAGGQMELWLRWRVSRADHGGWLPRRCHAPEITDLRFSASLEHVPAELSVRGRTERTFHALPQSHAPLFGEAGAQGDCWWLGFDAPPGGRLLRLYLTFQSRVPGGRLTAREGGEDGRDRPLTVLEDGSDGLSHSGMIVIDGIVGGRSLRFGLRRWWLCLQDDSGRLAQSRKPPCLEKLSCGAVCLRAESGGQCRREETFSPLRGGPVSGIALTDGFGGSPAEDSAAFLRRARTVRHHYGRCVSALDVDEMICGRLRDVLRTRCVREGDTLYVAALMRDAACHEAAFSRKKKLMKHLLEQYSVLPALGLRIAVREPVFYPVNAMVWIRPDEGVTAEAFRHTVCDTLNRFLHPAAGHFQGKGWRIGSLPGEMEVRNYLQSALPDLAAVKLLLTAVTPDGRELDCAQVDDPYALPLPGVHTVRLMEKEGLFWIP